MRDNQLNQIVQTEPMVIPKTVRRDSKRVLTSGYAGKVLPLAYVPLLREDRVSRGRMRFNFEMMETGEMLMNAVNVTVQAHFVPHLAFERFGGSMDRLNRSYAGEPDSEGGPTIEYFRTDAFDRAWEITRTLGMHARTGQTVNTAVFEAYNAIVNQARKAASSHLPLRDQFDKDLAAAFWKHTNMGHIVPDFDQAKIDGEVSLNLTGNLPVKGIYSRDGGGLTSTVTSESGNNFGGATFTTRDLVALDPDTDETNGFGAVYAEMAAANIQLSLSNIEMAKQTAAFAQIRAQYKNIDDDFIIDLLMQGIRVPEEQMSQPILLAQGSTIFGYNRRYATDSGNLDESVTNGETSVELTVRTPPMNTGGIIMYTAQIVPEQLFERQKDYYFTETDVAKLPNTQNDFLDPQKVTIVPKEHVDLDHTDPDGTFGYAPLNHQWNRNIPNVGGKYYRPQVDAAFDEDRQKIWANETVDPELTEDFYLANTIHHKVFAATNQDPFEIIGSGEHDIVGNTVFGKGLQEASDDYEQIMAGVDTTLIDPKA